MRTIIGNSLIRLGALVAVATLSRAERAGGLGISDTEPPSVAATTSQVAATQPSTTAPAAVLRVAHMRLAGEVPDSPASFSLWGAMREQMTLSDWLQRLAKARNDSNVGAVALEVDNPQITWAQAQELAGAIERLKETKPVHAFLAGSAAEDYLVASAGGEVCMDPAGQLEITGLAAEVMFFRGTLDLLGIQAQIVQVGRFKGAAEPLTQTQPSQEMQETYNWLLDDLYAQLIEQIARQRALDRAAVQAAIDAGPLSAQAAKEFALVDSLIEKADWRDDLTARLSDQGATKVVWLDDYGRKEHETIDFSNPFALLRTIFAERPGQEIRDPTIAIVHVDGLIVPGVSDEGLFASRLAGARTLVKCINQLADDDRVKAVVVRINSPGGSAMASELIYQAVSRCAARKPVVASISQVAASGGYYVAVAAPTIFSDPVALTGSIGVVSGKVAFSGLLDKIGITRYELTRGRNAGLWLSRPWTGEQEQAILKLTERTYDLFARRVTDSRADRIEDIDSVAQGRVFTARQALASGLIDEVGGLREAITAAQDAAGVERCHFVTLPAPRSLLDLLAEDDEAALLPITPEGLAVIGRMAKARGFAPHGDLAGVAYLLNLTRLLGGENTLAAMPYYLSIQP